MTDEHFLKDRDIGHSGLTQVIAKAQLVSNTVQQDMLLIFTLRVSQTLTKATKEESMC